MRQENQLVAFTSLHANTAQPFGARVVCRTRNCPRFLNVLVGKYLVAEVDAFIAYMDGGSGNERPDIILSFAAKRTSKDFLVVGKSGDVGFPVLAESLLKSFFQCSADVKQLPSNLAALRRDLGFEKVADRRLKCFQCKAVLLFADQVGAFSETKPRGVCRHRIPLSGHEDASDQRRSQ